MAHAAAPRQSGDTNGVAFPEIVHISNDPARLHDLHRLRKGVIVAASYNHFIHTHSMRLLHDLLDDPTAAVVDDLRRAKLHARSQQFLREPTA